MNTVNSTLPPGARSHLDAPCPACGARLLDRSPGGIPGEVACSSCEWRGEWLGTTDLHLMARGGATARFQTTTTATES